MQLKERDKKGGRNGEEIEGVRKKEPKQEWRKIKQAGPWEVLVKTGGTIWTRPICDSHLSFTSSGPAICPG